MSDDRTEQPTPKRREDARRKGQIARRPELPAAAGFLAAIAVLRATGEDWGMRAGHLFTNIGDRISVPAPLTLLDVHRIMIDAVTDLALLSLPVIASALVAGLAANFAQGGFTVSAEALKPQAERFNPGANLKRVFGPDRIVELLKECLVLGGLAGACYGVLLGAVEKSAGMVGMPAAATAAESSELLYQLGFRAGLVLLLIGAFNYAYAWFRHEKSLRMTKQELKDEYRQQEGDPMVKAQRRRAARALTQRQIIKEVPTADVVVTNPIHFAVALRYDREKDAAPMVVAKGADLMAKRIREIAEEYDVPVVENPPLARALYRRVEVSRVIPPDLFRAVAELLAYVYRLRNRAKQSE
jgi:flagellar biosynthetic protein FlhB